MSEKRFNPDKAELLLSDDRKERLRPDHFVDMHFQQEDAIADVGAGNGFFTLPLAKKTNNTVYAVDIAQQMLDMLKERAGQEGCSNIQYVISDLENIRLEQNLVNKVLAAFVIHEVESIAQALAEMKRIVKPGGEIVLIEWEAVETEAGPPLHERISSAKMKEILQENNFDAEIIQINEENYAVKARPLS
ncbi:Methyltransferase domain-containing protein [Alteribacillus persepolensis]|uniref:Methyltransferase domain-containing protein n=1 Tax=Alteribacillus persepolensis TaxID=568899 RepID=A0A1G8FX00_9BACI|nr:class I SAM-dependent methyltransferase [Alteribacillus persepolensis]SDH86678.1 Methyltransferase domain-containing protein [Alteribacillus persepolensis]